MKIAIASDDGKHIASHIGRAKGFVIVELEGKTIKTQEYRPNTFTGHARGLEHAPHAQDRHGPLLNALNDCQVVISHGMGRRIYEDLKHAGFEVFMTNETEIQKVLELYLNGKLIHQPELACTHAHREDLPHADV